MASLQGPVRPVWLQGSSVTYSVAPRARSPACFSATISAWSRAIVLVESLAEDRAILDDDAANRGIGAGQTDAFARQVQRVLHEMEIVGVVHR